MSDSPTSKANEPVPSHIRNRVLNRDNHRCQVCHSAGPQAGGVAPLEVHHKDPHEEDDRHAMDNLLALCRDCHRWHHLQPEPEEVPITLSDADKQQLRAHDYEILQVLATDGPMRTGEIRDAITPDLSVMAVRERLYQLMGLDDRVDSRERRLIDQDVETGRWGLPDDISMSERGRIPPSVEALIQRVIDEHVRRAVDRDVDRQAIAEVFDVGTRTTYHKESRARAYQIPLDQLISDRGRPTRVPPEDRNTILDIGSAQLRLANIDSGGQSDHPKPSSGDDLSHRGGHTDCGDDSSPDGSDDHLPAE